MLIPTPYPRRAAALAVALAALLVAAPGCGSDEETLTIYSGRDAELIEPVFERFTDETGIEVEVRYGDTAELASTIIEEGDRSPADVFVGQDAGALGALDAEGLLAELPARVLDRVPSEFRGDDGTWVGVSGRARVIAYGQDVDEAEVPGSVFELTDPRWEGRVGWAPTNASFQAFITAMRLEEGEETAREWLEEMAANGTQVYESNSVIRDAIEAGEIDLGLINHYYVAQAKAELGEGYAVDVSFPANDIGSLINVAGAAELEPAESPEAATRLIEFLLATEQQEYFTEVTKEYPLVEGIEIDAELPPLSELPAPEIDLENLADLEGTLELLRETGAL